MASTYTEKKHLEQQAVQTTPRAGVSAGTHQQLSTLQQGYKPSQNVQNAQNQLTQVQAQRPTAFNSPYTQQLDGIYQQIISRQPFKYDLNGDMLYQNAKDQYVQGGKQAMMDTMGQAATLTGGYGNSYASTAGNQAYQQYLLQLNAMVPEFYDRAAAQHAQQGQELYQQYGMMQDRENADYGRYQDSLAQWNTDMAMAQNAYNNAYSQDYGAYQDALGYWQQQAAGESADYWAIREQSYNMAMQMLANGQMPSADLLAAAGISQVDAQTMMPAPKKSSGGGVVRQATAGNPAILSDTMPLKRYYDNGGTQPLNAGYGPVRSQEEIEAAYAQAVGAYTQQPTGLLPLTYDQAMRMEELRKKNKGG